MSESKAEYYAKHLEALVEPEVQPTGLPTLLAGMVNEYHGALKLNGYSGFPDRLVEGFNQMLLACAQPLLAEYLTKLTTPLQFVVTEDNPWQKGKVSALIDALNKNEREADRIRSGKL